MFTKAKIYNLPSANWMPKKASGVFPVQIQRLKNQGSQWYKSQSESESKGLKTGELIPEDRRRLMPWPKQRAY